MRVALCLLLLMLAACSRPIAATLDDAAERYRPYMIEGIGSALAGARDLRERVAAKDLAGARKAWISARAGWERSEVFTAGFVPELDAQIDAWPNADSGFHAIEAKLFGAGRTDVEGETDALVESPRQSVRQASRHAVDAAGSARRHRAACLRGWREQGRWRRIPHQRNVARRHAQQRGRHRFCLPTIFATHSRRPTPGLPMTWRKQIEQLKTIVAATDLPHVDIPASAPCQRGTGGRAAERASRSWDCTGRRWRLNRDDDPSFWGPLLLRSGFCWRRSAGARRGLSGRRRPDGSCPQRPN